MKIVVLLAGNETARAAVRPYLAMPGAFALIEGPEVGMELNECLRLEPDLVAACIGVDLSAIRKETKAPILAVGELDAAAQLRAIRAGADECANGSSIRPKVESLLADALRRRPISVSGVVLDPRARRVLSKGGGSVRLTSHEFAILEALMRAAGSLVTRDSLIQDAFGAAGRVQSQRALEVHISSLRKKLALRKDLIRSVRGAGYLIVDESLQLSPDARA